MHPAVPPLSEQSVKYFKNVETDFIKFLLLVNTSHWKYQNKKIKIFSKEKSVNKKHLDINYNYKLNGVP